MINFGSLFSPLSLLVSVVFLASWVRQPAEKCRFRDWPRKFGRVYISGILLAILWCAACATGQAQAGTADYTSDLPSVARVTSEIKGSSPTDTLARQVAVFNYLYQYVDNIKYARTVRGPYTPGEQRTMTAYRNTSYQISQDYAKTHTPDEAKAFERLHGQYEMNSDFYADWSKRLIGARSAAANKEARSSLAATQRAHVAQEQQQYQRDAAAQQAAAGGLSSDPTAVATRRCLELGGSNTGCMGKGFMSGLMDMVGFGAATEEALIGPGRVGVILRGLYKNPATTATLTFEDSSVSLGGCGKLVAENHSYTVDKRPGVLHIRVENEPRPILLDMRPDGGLSGPGLIDVKGSIIIGYHTVTSTLYKNGQPAICGAQICQTTTSVPDYAPKIERCTIGSLSAPPVPRRDSAQSAADSGPIAMLTGFMNTISPGGDEAGLRMAGKYTTGMLLLDFSSNSLVLDCGRAHVRQPYTVENAPSALLIHVNNSGGPFTLALQPDNTLRGTGSTTVNGRLVTGMNGDNVAFAAHSERCDVGTFRPGSSASPPPSTATLPSTNRTDAAAPRHFARDYIVFSRRRQPSRRSRSATDERAF